MNDPRLPSPDPADSADQGASTESDRTDAATDEASVDERAGSAIRLAGWLVTAESLALVALAAFELISVDSDRPSVGITTAVFFLLYAAGLAACARGLMRLRSWSRGPIVLAQLIELGVAWSFFGNGTVWVAVVLVVPAVAVLVVMFSPATTEALYGHRFSELEDDDPDRL